MGLEVEMFRRLTGNGILKGLFTAGLAFAAKLSKGFNLYLGQ